MFIFRLLFVLNMSKRSSTMGNILGNEHASENCDTAQPDEDKNGPEGATIAVINGMMLPPEIMRKIFLMLNNKDLSNVVAVCRSWRDVGECAWNWDNQVYHKVTYIYRRDLDMLAIKRVEHVRKLMINDGDDWSVDDVNKLFETLRNLTKLTCFSMLRSQLAAVDPSLFVNTVLAIDTVLLSSSNLTDEQLSMLFEAIDESSKLKNLELGGIDLSRVGQDILAAGVNKLKRLGLFYAKMDDKQLTALLTQAGKKTNLESLFLLDLFRGRDPDEVVGKDIVRLAKLNIRHQGLH